MDLSPSTTEASETSEPPVSAAIADAQPFASEPQEQPEDELKNLTQSLEHLRDDLRQAERELDAFSHTVSYDLRGYLRAISVSVHEVLTNHQNHLEPQSRQELVRVGDTLRRVGLVIDGMLRLSALTRAKMNIEELDMSYLVETVASEVCDRHTGKEIEMVIQPDIVSNGDERLVTAVLDSLLDNACKFSGHQADPRVEFGMTLVNGKKAYWVKDNGPGIPPAQAHRIFEPVEKLTANAGIGLSSVKRIIERHGGKVWAQSQPGRGASFFFTLGAVDHEA